jgi:integrase
MSPRRASLRVAHQSTCPNASRTSVDSLAGCKCKPSYYVSYRDRSGRPVKSKRVTDRRVAQEALTAAQAGLDAGRAGIAKRVDVTFDEWAATWEASLELANRRASTVRTYLLSVGFGREAFGSLYLHEIGNEKLRQLVRKLKARKMRDVTIAKHLRHLSACFEAALAEPENTGLEHNPVGRFRRSFVLNVQPSEANYFTDGELAKLWAQLRAGLPRKDGTLAPVPPVYLHLCRFAVATGARIGELLALRWGDVKLAAGPHGEVRISKSWGVDGETAPKTRKSTRTLHLTVDARRVLGEVAQLSGMQDDSALVFANGQDGHLSGSNISNRILNPALVAAGIPKVGDDSPEPRSFHTFRHNYARAMLEAGQPLQWVADELGQESTATTELVYGHWAKQARRDAAGAVRKGTLPV